MLENNIIDGFSKLNRDNKINLLNINDSDKRILNESNVNSAQIQEIVNELSENTISTFPYPMGIAPNMMINGRSYFLPLITEESSVVAAISKAAKFWALHGGFKADLIGTTKKGQIHFFWKGSKQQILSKFEALKSFIFKSTKSLTANMENRGGGISNISFLDKRDEIPYYYNIDFSFETADAMGANFINTCLENAALSLQEFVKNENDLDENLLDINMAILSNYTPESMVNVKAECSVSELNSLGNNLNIQNFTERFVMAVQIAKNNVSRAVTHNKGIFNGIDAALLATANDWRAVEACAHAYASRNGQYRSLSNAFIKNDKFTFELTVPMAIGTVGGVTSLHPIAKIAMKILGNPNAKELMTIVASSGLAANFSAITALVTTGIQDGHMRMHKSNINLLK